MGIAGVAEMLGDKFSADAVENKAEELAYGWALLAQENERVRIVVKFLVETTALSEAIAPTVIVGGAIAWHYNLIPDKVGVPMATIAGAVPLSREQEVELRRRAEAELKQQEAAAEAADQYENENEPEPSEAEPSPINKGTPQVVPLPSDADIGPST
jgi:hypothetical protein